MHRKGHHGQPKQAYVCEFQRNARDRMSQVEVEPNWQCEPKSAPPPTVLRSLFAFLPAGLGYRWAHSQRYALATLLVLAVAGCIGVVETRV